MSSLMSSEEIKTLVIYDVETTGLIRPVKITELTLVAVSAKHFLGNNLPRVQHKLTVCFEPEKEIKADAVALSGLDNQLLEEEEKFDMNAANLINNFVQKLRQPVCLIAHNGDAFDFLILKNHFTAIGAKLPANLKSCDSVKFFRAIDPPEAKTKKSYKQSDIYMRLFSEEPEAAHEAEADVKNLLKCLFERKGEFLRYVNQHCKTLA